MKRLFLTVLLASALGAQPVEDHQLDLQSFEKVWTTVRDRHWQEKPGGLDWEAIHSEFRPRAEAAKTREEMRGVLREMLGRLHQTHFGIIPATVYSLVIDGGGEGSSGLDLRVIDGGSIVTRLDPNSGAERAGVRLGWKVVSADGSEFSQLIAQTRNNPSIHELQLVRSLLAKLTGTPGATTRVVFDTGGGEKRTLDLPLTLERGEMAGLGNLPAQRVWFEAQKIGNTQVVRFNLFLDLVRVMKGFEQAVTNCQTCDGLIIDLRGNAGGIGGMAMGMAGFLIDEPDQKLGTMYLRDTTLKFGVNPRPEVFHGPVAILVDSLSASTSEILAGGLQDLHRARVFGTKTAAAALPSNFELLPNGDGFQFAVANYISEGGKPLEGLGVTPDVEVRLTREALLRGSDPVLDAAQSWIQAKKGAK